MSSPTWFKPENPLNRALIETFMYKINKQKCMGCGYCLSVCPGATEIEKDGKAKVIDEEKLKKCGGEDICPYQAIETTEKKEK